MSDAERMAILEIAMQVMMMRLDPHAGPIPRQQAQEWFQRIADSLKPEVKDEAQASG